MRPQTLQRKSALVREDPVSGGGKVPASAEDPSADIGRIRELLEQIEARLPRRANQKPGGDARDVMTRSRSTGPKSI